MANRASLEHLDFLVEEGRLLAAEYVANPAWVGSPFEWVTQLPPGARGAVGRNLAASWATYLGLEVRREGSHNQHYVAIEGHRVQVKLSTLWDSGVYRFQQIRDQDYEFLLCIGLSPDDVHAWLIPKDEAFVHLPGANGQHTGAGASETYWLELDGYLDPPWVEPFGNQLSHVRRLLEALR